MVQLNDSTALLLIDWQRGFGDPVWLVTDATATFERVGPTGRRYSAAEMHDSALTSLQREFATLVTTAEILAAL
ncbi:MAG: hypothetical protein ACKO7W_15815 [Elainella sp.]